MKDSSICPRKSSRKRVTARRRGQPEGLRNKITWWLEKQVSAPATPSKSSSVQEESLASPTVIPATPEVFPPSAQKTPAGRRKKRAYKQRLRPATTPTTRNSPTQDSSPVLSSRKHPKGVPASKSTSFKISEKRAASLSGCKDSKQPSASKSSSLDRKWNSEKNSTTEEQDERTALRQ